MQNDREIAEMIAKFRTPPGFNWKPLADDIETVLGTRRPRTPERLKSLMVNRRIMPVTRDETFSDADPALLNAIFDAD